ncbi:MAG TPA: FAD-binding oxidoreductase [Candidatus Paceibacterota bacterium]|nr:FAD-binding oxidoreductase [Candidatus Paceibacterota bacterium]
MEISTDKAELAKASRDTSLFEVMPSEVAWPKDVNELAELVKSVGAERQRGAKVSITARAAGTDMSGGPLNTGTIVEFTKYMNRVLEVGADYAVTEPGVYYRDFEKATLARGLILPSYPASRELCAMGGIVANNSGGERTLEYGKTERYVEELECVLADGSIAAFKALSPSELQMKKVKNDFEGQIYRAMDALLAENAALIEARKPKVSKNSAGYYLWDIRTPEGGMNLAKLICGSQGTLALWTKAKLGLVRPKPHRAMLVGFLEDLSALPEIVAKVLPFAPESFESYDDKTFTLAIKFLPQMLAQMGLAKAARLGVDFIPEALMVAEGGVPKLILMAEFAEETIAEADQKAQSAMEALAGLPIRLKIEKNEKESEKYWVVRRESFSLLRKNLHGLYAAPFIDDFVVPPASYPQFLPELNALLAQYEGKMIYTIAGHIGNGNFHIIPLMDLASPATKQVVLELAPKVYALVIKYGGTTTGEHNDGIIRTPYLPMLFGPEMMRLFEETKKTFDPGGIFNPGKKVGGSFADIGAKMLRAA